MPSELSTVPQPLYTFHVVLQWTQLGIMVAARQMSAIVRPHVNSGHGSVNLHLLHKETVRQSILAHDNC